MLRKKRRTHILISHQRIRLSARNAVIHENGHGRRYHGVERLVNKVVPNLQAKTRARWLILALAIAATALIAWLGTSALASVTYYPAGKDIVYDDFGFTATRATASQSIGSTTAPAGKSFYVIQARVTNFAKRVDFEFRPEIVKLYSPEGEACSNAPQAQSALDLQLGKPQ